MKILLTGGSGFIGRNIRESFLADKYEIIAPSRDQLDCFDDRSVADFFSANQVDVIIHSAAKPGHRNAADPTGILYANSRMTVNLLKHHASWGKLINMGSGAIYDMEHYQPKMKEEYFGTHIPRDEHGYNKYLLGLLYPHYKGCVDLRIFGIFGKYEDYAIRFISNAICKALFGLPITLRQNRKFDYLLIDDLYPVLDYFIMNEASFDCYNVTPDHSVELLELAKRIKDMTGSKSEIIVANGGMGVEYSGDNTRLKKELPSLKFTDIESSLANLIEWYRQNLSRLRKEALLTDK